MIEVRALPGINMRHQVQNAVPSHDVLPGCNGNGMTVFNSNRGIYFYVSVHDDHVAHFSST